MSLFIREMHAGRGWNDVGARSCHSTYSGLHWVGIWCAIALAATQLRFQAAAAQSYPTGPVKLIVTTGAGSGPDVIARITAENLSRRWGQQVYVLNHPGAAGALGMKIAGTAAPDGYTLMYAQASSFITVPEVQAKFPFDLLRDFVTIGYVSEQPMAIAVSPSLGIGNLSELIVRAGAKPGEFNIAVLSRGGLPHLTAEWLKLASRTSMTAVNYSSTPQGLSDVLGGRVQAIIDGLPGVASNVAGGTLKLLALGSTKRLPNFPNVPTINETLPTIPRAVGWAALMAPPGTPEAIASKVSEDLRAVLTMPELQRRFQEIAANVRPMTRAETLEYIREEQQIWQPAVAQIARKPSN